MGKGKVSLAPEGLRIISISAALVIVAVLFSMLSEAGRGLWLPAASAVWFLLVVYFFRDPHRIIPKDDRIVVSPADGKIISVGEALDGPLSTPGQRVSIFMSPLNVHVNRAPISGTVESARHRSGRFRAAFKPTASYDNEQVEVIMNSERGRLAFRQIAGFIARRIVFHPRPGDDLSIGQRVGMIRFGSRVDLFLPGNVELKISLGDRVTAGETIIGEFIDA